MTVLQLTNPVLLEEEGAKLVGDRDGELLPRQGATSATESGATDCLCDHLPACKQVQAPLIVEHHESPTPLVCCEDVADQLVAVETPPAPRQFSDLEDLIEVVVPMDARRTSLLKPRFRQFGLDGEVARKRHINFGMTSWRPFRLASHTEPHTECRHRPLIDAKDLMYATILKLGVAEDIHKECIRTVRGVQFARCIGELRWKRSRLGMAFRETKADVRHPLGSLVARVDKVSVSISNSPEENDGVLFAQALVIGPSTRSGIRQRTSTQHGTQDTRFPGHDVVLAPEDHDES
jgi:hypothetical protein